MDGRDRGSARFAEPRPRPTGPVLTLTVLAFFAHQALHVEPATVALGAGGDGCWWGIDPREASPAIEWTTLFFFIGLFVMVGALEATGIIAGLAESLIEISGGRADVATIALLWFSAGVSAIVDNIPYTATAIPVVQAFAASGVNAEPLWWALALGASLGNLTIVGARPTWWSPTCHVRPATRSPSASSSSTGR